MNAQYRKNGFIPPVYFNRSSRIFNNDSGYYYKTREGEVRGSFPTEAEARYDLNHFVELIQLEQELQSMDFQVAV
ncbi:DUF6316 family protein [Aliikangiella sp. IMCC44359]|uniref:DUF6316 family protein n=1 Tax=Aliikangiella sp. IMCC44359 TaxID=3459125 RepID=UPI00403B0264